MNSTEIAKLANVSRSTVSRVINNYKNVPIETREKVQAVIAKYGYTPNVSARTLAGKSNNIIGLFLADIDIHNSNGKYIGATSPYNAELLSHIIDSCKNRGYLTLVYTISDMKECQEMEQYFINRMIFGGIFVGFPYRTQEVELLAKKEHNIVLIDQLSIESDLKKEFKLVNSNDAEGGYLATKHLIEQGHTKIVYVDGDYRLSAIERKNGFLKAMTEANILVKDKDILKGEYREDIAYKVMKKYLEKECPTAVFVANDIMALGVVRAIQEKGLSIPEEISVIGYDGLVASAWNQLNLTTMKVDLSEVAERSVAMLFDKNSSVHKECHATLVMGNTVNIKKV